MNMAKKEKIKNIEFAEVILFWTWVNNDILGLVTATAIYHINITTQDSYTKVCDRYPYFYFITRKNENII
jgi:clathrin heavy chain